MRKTRLLLNFYKLRQMLGVETEPRTLQEEYLRASKLDGKPEKGERKVADDFIVLLNEQQQQEEPGKPQDLASMLYLASLNEFALMQSPYNFDINVAQVKLYDRLGMSLSFQAAHQELDLKGVQLESLGFLQLDHTLRHGTFESLLRPVFQKFQRYSQHNDADLRKLKLTSLREDNYEQIENFVEYEAYLHKSYFGRLQREVHAQFTLMRSSAANMATARDHFTVREEVEDAAQMTRTQDLKVVLPKYSPPPIAPQV